MKRSLFARTQDVIQVGGLDTASSVVLAADTQSTAFAADTVIEVSPYDGIDAWVAIGTDPTATAETSGNAFIAGGATSRPFRIDKGDKIISTQAICITIVD